MKKDMASVDRSKTLVNFLRVRESYMYIYIVLPNNVGALGGALWLCRYVCGLCKWPQLSCFFIACLHSISLCKWPQLPCFVIAFELSFTSTKSRKVNRKKKKAYSYMWKFTRLDPINKSSSLPYWCIIGKYFPPHSKLFKSCNFYNKIHEWTPLLRWT